MPRDKVAYLFLISNSYFWISLSDLLPTACLEDTICTMSLGTTAYFSLHLGNSFLNLMMSLMEISYGSHT